MVAVSKKARGLKKKKLARDDHARVPLGIPTALFPYHADLALFTHSQRPVLHYMKVILQEITHGKVSGGLMVKDSGPTAEDRHKTLKSARRSRIESETIL